MDSEHDINELRGVPRSNREVQRHGHTASGPSKDEIGRTRISKGVKYGMESEKLTYKYGIPEQLRIPERIVTAPLMAAYVPF